MAADPEFLEHARDLFAGLGPIRVGRMFGGSALYIEDAMFAMIIGDAIFMKADKDLAAQYADAGAAPFEYDTKKGVRVIPGLMALPDSAVEDPDEALIWAQKSLIPAKATAAEKRGKKAAKQAKT
jgi:DNA transformation protein and related proteins